MDRLSHTRSRPTDLLARPPCTAHDVESAWTASYVDPVAQLQELADLRARGLLSRDEFERQKAKVIGR
jgi:Short C-terminal domain